MDENYSHLVLQMVPRVVDFEVEYCLDFLSKYIAEKVVSNVDQDNLKRLSKLTITHKKNTQELFPELKVRCTRFSAIDGLI
jgi:Holliday junction resolvasome RuvABC DNA-binding subunit